MNLFDGILGNVVGSVLGGGTSQGSRNPLGAILHDLGGAGGNNLGNLGNLGGLAGMGNVGGMRAGAGVPAAGLLLTAALGLIQQNGGLDGVLQRFRQSGLADHADSWVGTGPNRSIDPGQIEQALGPGALSGVASQLGLSGGQAGSAMARILPELINQLTPHGQVPADHADLVSQGLTALKAGQP